MTSGAVSDTRYQHFCHKVLKFCVSFRSLASPSPGPNAPLSDACGNSTQPLANVEAAIRTWINAGFPASQIVLGVPAYGYVSRSDEQQLATRDEGPGLTLRGETMEMGVVEVKSGNGSGDSGQIQFNQLVKQGALVRNNGGEYDGVGEFERRWDACSSTVRFKGFCLICTNADDYGMLVVGRGLLPFMGCERGSRNIRGYWTLELGHQIGLFLSSILAALAAK